MLPLCSRTQDLPASGGRYTLKTCQGSEPLQSAPQCSTPPAREQRQQTSAVMHGSMCVTRLSYRVRKGYTAVTAKCWFPWCYPEP